jgi:hypothetical protein
MSGNVEKTDSYGMRISPRNEWSAITNNFLLRKKLQRIETMSRGYGTRIAVSSIGSRGTTQKLKKRDKKSFGKPKLSLEWK